MRLRIFFVIALLAALAVACGGRAVSGGGNDAGPGSDGSSIPDGSTIPDGSVIPDSGTCSPEGHLLLASTQITALYLSQPDVVSEGQAMRVFAGFEYGGCDSFGKVDYQIEHNTRTIHVEGQYWRDTRTGVPCTDELAYGEEPIVLLGLAPGLWRVADRSLGGLEIFFTVEPCGLGQDCQCTVPNPVPGGIDAACTFDCECAQGLSCFTHWGFGGPFSSCGRSCATSDDCWAGEECRYLVDGPQATCGTSVIGCEQEGCPPGMECVTDAGDFVGYCQANYGFEDLGKPCTCDADCKTGLLCSDWPDSGQTQPSCQWHCRGDRECAPGGICGDLWSGGAPVCYYLQW